MQSQSVSYLKSEGLSPRDEARAPFPETEFPHFRGQELSPRQTYVNHRSHLKDSPTRPVRSPTIFSPSVPDKMRKFDQPSHSLIRDVI